MSSTVQASRELDDSRGRRRLAQSIPPGSRKTAGTPYETLLTRGYDEPRLDRQFRHLVENIVTEIPAKAGGTLLFAGIGSNSHVADVAGHVTRQLTMCQRGEAVLVDADSTQKVLTQRFAATTERGLAEAIGESLPVANLVVTTAISNLGFLPFGETVVSRRSIASPAAASILTALRRDYHYVVVAACMDDNPLATTLSRYCDGTYLLVQLGSTDKQMALRAERQLTAAGARLLGCVATGVR